MRSLRARLLVLVAGSVLLAWVATAVFSYFDARHEIDEMLDAHLAQSAGLLVAQVGGELHELQSDTVERSHKYERRVAFQVWDGDTLRLRSASAPAARMSPAAEGFADSVIDGHRWRVFSRPDDSGRYTVQVGERYRFRDELARSVAGHLLHPLIVAVPALAALIWFSTAWGLAPLRRIAREVEARAPENLGALGATRAPREIVPLIRALNALFQRVTASLDKERRFTADAAHELRTPLAAVKTQAQVALNAQDEAQRRRALGQVVSGVDRATRLTEQLLTLSRLEPAAASMHRHSVRLDELAAVGLVEMAPAAAAKDIDIGLEGAPATVAGDDVLLGVLLRNLVDNAIRYSPPGASVSVSTGTHGGAAVLRVSDSGPGIPPGEHARVWDRFYRVLGSGEQGSGLGLSIVKRIADLHGAQVHLREGAGGKGLVVEVVFPGG